MREVQVLLEKEEILHPNHLQQVANNCDDPILLLGRRNKQIFLFLLMVGPVGIRFFLLS